MTDASKLLFSLTASDLMSRDVVAFPPNLPMRDAAQRLRATGIHGAPVVDSAGKCIGVLSVTDFLRRKMWPVAEPMARACPYQKKCPSADGSEKVVCTLPLGTCPAQRVQGDLGGQTLICALPHSIFTDWQVVEQEDQPVETVVQFMTADPVTVMADRSITDLARMMLDANIHRIIVTDQVGRPIGVVSSTDLLAALATPEDVRSSAEV